MKKSWKEYALKGKKITALVNIFEEGDKSGWLTVQLDPRDSRIRIYKLKEPNEIVYGML